MDDVFIFCKATLIVLKNFFLAVIFAVIGLVYIYFDERRDKYKKKPLRQPSEKVQYK